MGLESDAVAVAAGELSVVEASNVLELAEANRGRAIPVAAHRAEKYCVTFFIIRRSDGWWQTEVVPVRSGEVDWYGGASGGLARRSEVEPGEPLVDGIARLTVDDDSEDEKELVQVNGVAADDRVRLTWMGEVVAEATVAPHGYFVLTAILPSGAEITVEAP